MRHDELIDLVLQCEDLTEEEQTLAAAHLDDCPACRVLLEKLRGAEKSARNPGDLPALPPDPDGDPSGGLTGDDLRQARESRKRLLARVRVGRHRSRLTPLGWGGVSLALAACLALVLWFPWHGGEAGLILDARLTPPRVLRGAETADLQPGDSFVVRFSLAEPGWPVVVTLAPGGTVEVLHPPTAGTPVEATGRPVVIPAAGSPVTWRLPDTATTVWIALDRAGAADPEVLRRDLARAATESRVTAYLEERFGRAAVSVVNPARP